MSAPTLTPRRYLCAALNYHPVSATVDSCHWGVSHSGRRPLSGSQNGSRISVSLLHGPSLVQGITLPLAPEKSKNSGRFPRGHLHSAATGNRSFFSALARCQSLETLNNMNHILSSSEWFWTWEKEVVIASSYSQTPPLSLSLVCSLSLSLKK